MTDEVARIASAPARINLLGEHCDHQGGTVLPVAVSLRTTVRYTPGAEWTFSSEGHEDDKDDDWTRYPQGVIELLTAEGHEIVPGRLEVSSNIANRQNDSGFIRVLMSVSFPF